MSKIAQLFVTCSLVVFSTTGQAFAQQSPSAYQTTPRINTPSNSSSNSSSQSFTDVGRDLRNRSEHQVADTANGFPTLLPSAQNNETAKASVASSSKSFGPLVTTGFSLVVVLGLFAGLVWVTRRYGNGSMTQSGVPSNVMKSLGSTAIDARTRVTLLRCGNRIIVMAQTATGVHPLSEITDPAEVQRLTAQCNGEDVRMTETASTEPTFADALRQANRRTQSVSFSG